MEYYKLSPASFAEQIGINRSNLTHLFSGRNQPSLDLAKKILNSYPEIKTEWLIMGVGEMMRSIEDTELNIKIQNEKKLYKEKSEPDLFTVDTLQQSNGKEPQDIPEPLITNVNAVESVVAYEDTIKEQIFDSREVEKNKFQIEEKPLKQKHLPSYPAPPIDSSRQTTKIVFFYSDSSFEIFHPSK